MTYENIKFLGQEFMIRSTSENDHIFRNIRASGLFYEMELLNYLRLLGITGRCAIDVGANIGNHSIFFSSFLAEQVISIEANTELVPILIYNLSANKCQHKVVASAVDSEPGHGRISFPLPDNVGAAKVTKGSGDIEITTLDHVAPTQGVFLVKIDVEGMEMDVLRGARELLSSQHPDLVIEAPTTDEFCAIDALLRPFGYRSLSRWNSTPTYHFSCDHGVWTKARVAAIRIYVRLMGLTRKVGRRLDQCWT